MSEIFLSCGWAVTWQALHTATRPKDLPEYHNVALNKTYRHAVAISTGMMLEPLHREARIVVQQIGAHTPNSTSQRSYWYARMEDTQAPAVPVS